MYITQFLFIYANILSRSKISSNFANLFLSFYNLNYFKFYKLANLFEKNLVKYELYFFNFKMFFVKYQGYFQKNHAFMAFSNFNFLKFFIYNNNIDKLNKFKTLLVLFLKNFLLD